MAETATNSLKPTERSYWERDSAAIKGDLGKKASFRAMAPADQDALIGQLRGAWGIQAQATAAPRAVDLLFGAKNPDQSKPQSAIGSLFSGSAPAPPKQQATTPPPPTNDNGPLANLSHNLADAGRGIGQAAVGIGRGIAQADKRSVDYLKNKGAGLYDYLKTPEGQQAAIETAGNAARRVGETSKSVMENPLMGAGVAATIIAPEFGPIGVSLARLGAAGLTAGQFEASLKSLYDAVEKPTAKTVGNAIGDLAMLAPILHEAKTIKPPEGYSTESGKKYEGIYDWLRNKLKGKTGPEAEKLKAAMDTSKPPEDTSGGGGNPPGAPPPPPPPPGNPPSAPPVRVVPRIEPKPVEQTREATPPFNAKEAHAQKSFGKPYGELSPDDRRKIDALVDPPGTRDTGPSIKKEDGGAAPPPVVDNNNPPPPPGGGATPVPPSRGVMPYDDPTGIKKRIAEKAPPPNGLPDTLKSTGGDGSIYKWNPETQLYHASNGQYISGMQADSWVHTGSLTPETQAPPVPENKLPPTKPPIRTKTEADRRPTDIAVNPKNIPAEEPTPITPRQAPSGKPVVIEETTDGHGITTYVARVPGEEGKWSAPKLDRLRGILEEQGVIEKGGALPEPVKPEAEPEAAPEKAPSGLVEGEKYYAQEDDPANGIKSGQQYIYRGNRSGSEWVVPIRADGGRGAPQRVTGDLARMFGEEEPGGPAVTPEPKETPPTPAATPRLIPETPAPKAAEDPWGGRYGNGFSGGSTLSKTPLAGIKRLAKSYGIDPEPFLKEKTGPGGERTGRNKLELAIIEASQKKALRETEADKEAPPVPPTKRTKPTGPTTKEGFPRLNSDGEPIGKAPTPPTKEATPAPPTPKPRTGPQKLNAGEEGSATIKGAPEEAPPQQPKPRSGPKRLGQKAGSSGETQHSEPQFAKTSGGKVKMGADVKALAEELGSSLYSGKAHQVVTKELVQNAFDAIRGATGGEVNVDIDRSQHTISVSDNGKGMTRKDLETVFVDLGASGKRNEEGASGGFGLAKAAPLMMSEQVEVTSVADDKGKRYKSTMNTNKGELLGSGAEIHTVEVPKSTPTGTTVRAIMPSDYYGMDDAKHFAMRSLKSINPPGKVNITEGGKPIDKDDYDYKELNLEERKNTKKATTIRIPGANVDVHFTHGEKGLAQDMGSIKVEINNHGIYQFDKSIYLGDSAAMKGVPSVISADVKATVKEGHPDYPFTANREEVRGEIDNKIREWVNENIVAPAMKRASDFIAKKYNALPVLGKQFGTVLYDSGSRLTPEELTSLQKNKDFTELSEDIAQTLDDALVSIQENSKAIETAGIKDLGENIERAGIVFSEKLHGVHVTNRATGKATIFINPFTASEGATPKQAASLAWHTIKHEILHDKVKGHNQQFTSGLVRVDEVLAEVFMDSLNRLYYAYADPANPGQFRKGISEALRIYKESRGRPEREADPLGGEASSNEDQ